MVPLARAAETRAGVKTAAVVGVGAVAKQHLACLAATDRARVVAVCDLSPAVAESAADRFGVPAHYADHREMLAAVAPDVVHVTTPPAAHFAVAMDALAAGAHVIVEKPIVADPEQLEPLLSEAERAGLVAIEDYNYVFNPQVREMTRLIATGELGALTHVEVDLAVDVMGEGSPFADRNRPHPTAGMPGGAVADFLPHLASLAYFLAGPHARVSSVWGDNEMRALVEAERATAALSFSAASQPDGFWVRVHGSRMRVEANLFEPRLTIERVRSAPSPLFPVLNGASEIAAVGRAAVAGLWGKLTGAPGAYSGLWELVARFYESIDGGAAPPVSPEDVRGVNRLIADLTAELRER
jgi:predicted dehydrogenase